MASGCDMIVNLTNLPEYKIDNEVKIKRAFAGDKEQILTFISDNFQKTWMYEAEKALLQDKCFIATRQGKVVGFACFDTTAKGFFGPTGVTERERHNGIGKALLIRTLGAMCEYGYGYAIIGWVSDAENFYRKTVNAEFVKGGEPENSVYSNMISM